MYNPDKQARAAGGRFGGKVAAVAAEIEEAAEEAVIVAHENVQEAADQIAGRPGEFVILDPMDYPDVANRAWLVVALFVAAVLGLIYGAVKVLF